MAGPLSPSRPHGMHPNQGSVVIHRNVLGAVAINRLSRSWICRQTIGKESLGVARSGVRSTRSCSSARSPFNPISFFGCISSSWLRRYSINCDRLLFVPLAEGEYEVQILAVWKMRDVRHACRTIVAYRLQLFLVLMRAHDHDVGTHMKFIAISGISRFIRNPGADVHVRDADRCNVRFAAGQAVFHPVHKNGIETAGLIMRIAGYSRQTSPAIRSLAQKAILTTGLLGPIQDRCVFCDERWPSSQGVGNLGGVRGGMVLRVLVKGNCCHGQKTEYSECSRNTAEKVCAFHAFTSFVLQNAC